MQVVTLLFLRREDEILLAMKKRGFGVGKWNGTGGKVNPGETVHAASIRECQEEIGVIPHTPVLVGRLTFLDASNPDFRHDAYLFVATEWQGEPHETEEMRPQWFNINDIPFEDMWIDDQIWMPLLLTNKKFTGSFTLSSLDNNKIVKHDISEVESL
jgi:ADP-ribose pyrophosphatase YjhB (NUDIX family)